MKLLLTSLFCGILIHVFGQSDPFAQDLKERWQPDHYTAITLQKATLKRDTLYYTEQWHWEQPDSIHLSVDFLGGANARITIGDTFYRGFKIDPGWNDSECMVGWIDAGPEIRLTYYRNDRPYHFLWIWGDSTCTRYTLEAKKE